MAASYEGRCHCGAIGFSYATDLPHGRWPVRSCQCSFCRAHGARSTSDPAGAVRFRISKPDALVRYSFALRTADFLLCRHCGVYVAAVLSAGDRARAIVNLNTFDPAVPDLARPEPVRYDAESRDGRVARRLARWTPVEEGP